MSVILDNNNPGKFDSLKRLRERLEVNKNNKKEKKNKEDQRIKHERKIEEKEKTVEKELIIKDVSMIDEVECITSSKENLSDEVALQKKQIDQLVSLFKKNKVIKNSITMQFIKDIFAELPPKLIDDMYDVYNDVELLKMKYG